MGDQSSGTYSVKAHTAEVTVTDADGTEWAFELVAESEPIELAVTVEQEPLEGPPSGAFRTFVPGPTHASVKVKGRLRARTAPTSASA